MRGCMKGYGSWFMVLSSWLVFRGLWCVVRGSWLVAQASWSVVCGSWIVLYGFNVFCFTEVLKKCFIEVLCVDIE